MDDLVTQLADFRGARVLLTGDTGFKGAWLALWLHELGAQVYGYSLPALTSEEHFELLGLRQKIQHQDGDLRDLATLQAFFERAQPEYVFHLAAQPLVRRSYRDPKETFDTNIGGSVNLLECIRTSRTVESFIYVTSDKCYRNKEWIWGYRENDELGGHDPYSASKAAAELVFAAYSNSFFRHHPKLGHASVRAGNVIGGGDWAEDRIVPDCIRALRKENPIVLRKPRATRPWQHVLEPLGGYLMLAQALRHNPAQFSGVWNFGPESESVHTVHDLAQQIVQYWGSGQIEIQTSPNDPHEAGLLHLNCDKAHYQLGWFPRWSMARTVRETVAWYRAYHQQQAIAEFSRFQIQCYMENLS